MSANRYHSANALRTIFTLSPLPTARYLPRSAGHGIRARPFCQLRGFLTGIAAGGYGVEVEVLEFAYALYAGDPSNGSSTTRVASFREGRLGYREWATRSGRINPSLEDRYDHDIDELMA